MDIVNDTNVVVSGLLWDGKPSRLLKLCKTGSLTNHISPPIVNELKRVLSYEKFELTEEEIANAIGLVLSFTKVVVPRNKIDVIIDDPSDNLFLECATACNAKVIISGDIHLLKLREYHGIKIMTVSDFLRKGVHS